MIETIFKLSIIFLVLMGILTFFKSTEHFLDSKEEPISPDQFKKNIKSLLSSMRKYMIKQKNSIEPTDPNYMSNDKFMNIVKTLTNYYKSYRDAQTVDVQKNTINNIDKLTNIVLIPSLNTSIENNQLLMKPISFLPFQNLSVE